MAVKKLQTIFDYIIDQFDPRASVQVGNSKPRVGEINSAKGTKVTVEDKPEIDIPLLDLRDFEGRGIVTSMSDRTAGGGILTAIDDVQLNQPVDLQGGQNFMFLNPGSVWASADSVVGQMQREAQKLKAATGKDPLYSPFRMAPGGMDFSTMPGDAMLSFIDTTASRKLKNELTQQIRQVVPEFKGFDGKWYDQYAELSGDQRKAIQTVLDARRDVTGIGSGKGRVAVTDQDQLLGGDGTLMNIGEISSSGKIKPSSHRTYPMNLPGEGVGRLEKNDVLVTQLFPETTDLSGNVRRTKDINNPTHSDVRSFQMRPIGGVIDEKMLRRVYGSLSGAGLTGLLGSLGIPREAQAGIVAEAARKASDQSDSELSQDAKMAILDLITGMMPITPTGGGVDTMEGYLRSQTR